MAAGDERKDGRVAWPGVESDDLFRAAADSGEVGDTADIDNRKWTLEVGGQSGVVKRHKRRPLAARRDISAAEIADHRNPDKFGQKRCVAKLPASPFLRPVQDGPAATLLSLSESMKAASMPSSEVPLISPMARDGRLLTRPPRIVRLRLLC